MSKQPKIQIDDLVREMTDDEYQALLDSGWTPGEEKPDDASEPA